MPIDINFAPPMNQGFGQAAYAAGQTAQAEKNRQYTQDYLHLLGQVAGQVAQQRLSYADLYQRASLARQQIQQQQAHDVFEAGQQWRQQSAGFAQQAARDQFQAHQNLIQLDAQLKNRQAEHVFDSQMGQAQEQARLGQQTQRDLFQAGQQQFLQQQQFGQQQARDQFLEQQRSQGQQELFQHQADMEQTRQQGMNDRTEMRMTARDTFQLNKLDNSLGWADQRLANGTISQEEYDGFRANILRQRAPLARRQQFTRDQDEQGAVQQANGRLIPLSYPRGHPRAGQPMLDASGEQMLGQMDRNGLVVPWAGSAAAQRPGEHNDQRVMSVIQHVDQQMQREATPPASAAPGQWQAPPWAGDPQAREAERQRRVQATLQVFQQNAQANLPGQDRDQPQTQDAVLRNPVSLAQNPGQVAPAHAAALEVQIARAQGNQQLATALQGVQRDLEYYHTWQNFERMNPARFQEARRILGLLEMSRNPMAQPGNPAFVGTPRPAGVPSGPPPGGGFNIGPVHFGGTATGESYQTANARVPSYR